MRRTAAERLVEAVAHLPVPAGNAPLASFGLAAWQPGGDVDDLLAAADVRLLEVKRDRR